MSYDKLAEQIGLPKRFNSYDWFSLSEDIFVSWFKWEDNVDERKLYLRYEPPMEFPAYYDYVYSFQIKSSLKLGTPLDIDFYISDKIGFCNLKCFMGKKYYQCLTAPKDGMFVNLIDLDRFKGVGETLVKKGETLFYIDYSNEEIDKYKEAKNTKLLEIERENELYEREQIKTSILEKKRKRDLEKEITQELIDSGELYPEANKRPPIPKELVDAIWNRDGGKCVYCDSTENIHLDHIIPFSKGGATCLENLQLLCQKCNLEKSNKIG